MGLAVTPHRVVDLHQFAGGRIVKDPTNPEPAGSIVDIVDEPPGAVQYLLFDRHNETHDVRLHTGARVR